MNSKLNNIEAIALLSIIMANKIILNLPELIITSTGSSAWLNTLYIIALSFLFIFIIFKLLRRFHHQDILDISEYLGGPVFKYIISIIQLVLLFFIASSVIRSFSYTLKTIYFTQSPIIFIVLFIIFPVIVSNKLGIKSISKICLYIIPVAYIGLAILLLAPTKDFEFQRIFPILGYGFNATFISGISNIYALSGLGYIFLMPSILDENTNIKKITTISLILSSIALFFSILCMLFVFSYHVNTNENMTLYLLTMVVHHGNIIHGINILFMIIWILSIVTYISTTVFFMILIIKKNINPKNQQILNYGIATLLIICAVLFQNNPILYLRAQDLIIPAVLCFIFLVIPIILILANLKKYIKNENI